MPIPSRIVRRIGLVLFFVLPPALLLAPVLTGTRLMDEVIHYFFFKGQAFLAWDLGQLPNWWPAYFSGYPSSLTLNGFLNPLFLLALRVLPLIAAYHWLTFFFFIVTLWSGYITSRAFGVSRAGSLIASCAWGYSGMVMEWTDVIVFTTLYPVLPLSFYACLKIHEGKRGWRWIWALLLAYAWIGGFSEIVVYFLVGVGAFCVVLLSTKPAYARTQWMRAPLATAWAFLKDGLVSYALPVVISLLIVSPWLVSVLFYVLTHSNRGPGLPVAEASTAPLTLSHAIHAILPRLSVPYGGNIPFLRLNDRDYHLFIGTIPVLLLGLLPWLRNAGPRYARWFFTGLLAFGLLVAWRSPLYLFLHALPVLKWFSQHSKWTYLTVFAASMLAGFAADAFFRACSPRHRTPHEQRMLKRVLLVISTVFLVGVAALSLVTLFARPLSDIMQQFAQTSYTQVAENRGQALPRTETYYTAILQQLSTSLIHGFSFRDPWTLTLVFLWGIAIVAIALPVFRPPHTLRWMRGPVVAVTLLGSVIPWSGFLEELPLSYLTTEPATAAWLHATEPYRAVPLTAASPATHIPYRVFTYIPEQTYAHIRETQGVFIEGAQYRWLVREMLEDNTNIWFDIDGSFNHEPLGDQALLEFRRQIIGARGTTSTQAFQEQVAAFASPRTTELLGIWNVKYVLTPLTLNAPWKQVFTSEHNPGGVPIFLYENPAFKPRWWLETEGELSLVQYTAGELTVRIHTDYTNRLVFSESASPFWRAEIDGQPAAIVRVHGAFLGIDVPPGQHTVTFRYPGFWEQSVIALKGLTNYFQDGE